MIATGIDMALAFHPDLDSPDCARGIRHAGEPAERNGIPFLAFVR